MVVSAGTRQLAAHRSQACRRACPAGTTNERRPAGRPGGVHLRPRLGPANSLSAVCVRGRRAVVKDIGVRLPNDGQAAADDARPRPPEDATNEPQRRCRPVRSFPPFRSISTCIDIYRDNRPRDLSFTQRRTDASKHAPRRSVCMVPTSLPKLEGTRPSQAGIPELHHLASTVKPFWMHCARGFEPPVDQDSSSLAGRPTNVERPAGQGAPQERKRAALGFPSGYPSRRDRFTRR